MSWVHERTITIKTEVLQIGLNYLPFNQRFRELRGSIKGCGLCKVPFEDGQHMHIAIARPGNELICQSCADIAISHGVPVPFKRDSATGTNEYAQAKPEAEEEFN